MSESKGPVNNQEFLGEKSAELLDNILNTSAVGIAYAKDRIILWANQAMLKLFGFTKKAQVLGKNTRMLYASEQEYQRVGQIAYQRQQADQIIELDAQFKRHDDSLFDAHVKINPLEPSAHIEGIIVSIMDITERKRTEAALRVSEKEMRALFAAMTDIVLVLDQKGQYLGIAPTNPDLLYRPADELLGKTLHQVFSREQADLFLAHIHRALEEQQPVHIEYSLIIAEKKKWFVAVLSPMSQETVVAVIRDITARKQAEQALQESEEKYRVLFESFPLGITITDQEGNVLEVNQESERLLRLPSADHKQRTIDGAQWQIIRPDGSPMPTKEYASVRALQDNRLIENVEMGIVQEQGAITWLNVTAAPIPLEGYGVAVAYGDITEQVRAQRALEQERDLSRTLINAAALVSSTLDPEQVLDRLLDQASRVIPNDAANIMLIEKSRKARIVRWRGYEQFGIEEFVSTALFAFDELPNLRQMFQTGRQIVIPDTATYSGWVNLPETTWLRSYAGAPIRVRDMVIGFLSLDSVTPNTFSALHADILRAFADHAAVALENARLYREVQKELAERKRLETQLVQAQKM